MSFAGVLAGPIRHEDQFKLAFCTTQDPENVKYNCKWHSAKDLTIGDLIQRVLETDKGMIGFYNGTHHTYYDKFGDVKRSKEALDVTFV